MKTFFTLLLLLTFSLPTLTALAADGPATTPTNTNETTVRSFYFILPNAGKSLVDCKDFFQKKSDADLREQLKGDDNQVSEVLGCAVMTGDIHMYMIPYFIRNILEFAIQIAGILSVAGIVFGGFWYMFSGISENQERGKHAILYGLVGMILTLTAWAIVNILISFLTS